MDEVAVLLAKRFIERKDVKAVQQKDGAYHPDRTPWKMGDLRAHVSGEKTFGHYLLNQEGQCKLFAFDIDLKKTTTFPGTDGDMEVLAREVWQKAPEHDIMRRVLAAELRCMAEGLARRAHSLLEIPVAIAYSGSKGLHVYGFTGTVPASEARAAAVAVLDSFGCFVPIRGKNFYGHSDVYNSLEIEIFPKQAEVTDLGNLMRLALGVHRKTGDRGFFLELTGDLHEFHEMDAVAALSGTLPWPVER